METDGEGNRNIGPHDSYSFLPNYSHDVKKLSPLKEFPL